MIFDKLENLEIYQNVHPRFAEAIAFMKDLIAQDPANGKHEMPNCDTEGAVYAKVSDYDTKPMEQSKMELHHQYIDVQIVLEGEECMYVPTSDGLTVTVPYNPEKDCEFMAIPPVETLTRITVPQGYFAIFFVNEPHAPGVSAHETPAHVRKVVGKILN